jgi:formylmethanofuran dehydrogenase subunit C
MSTITLTLKELPTVPLEAETLTPDALGGLSREAICAASLQHGKRQCRIDDFFEVETARGDDIQWEGEAPAEPGSANQSHETNGQQAPGSAGASPSHSAPSHHLILRGDLRRVKWIGRAMSRGKMTVEGSVGMHLGAYMAGGEIDVRGDAGDWIGAEMTGGLIRVSGNAGGQIGAAYRGSTTGMRNGTIIVGGTAGLEIGMRMKKGTIVVGGVVRDFAGLQMKGGNIIMLSGAEIRTGAWMMRGTIISLKPLPLLPTFTYDCSHIPPHLPIFSRYLRTLGVNLPCDPDAGTYEVYSGDTSVPGKGEILLWRARSM